MIYQANNVKARSDHHQLKKFIPFMMERSKTGKLIVKLLIGEQ